MKTTDISLHRPKAGRSSGVFPPDLLPAFFYAAVHFIMQQHCG